VSNQSWQTSVVINHVDFFFTNPPFCRKKLTISRKNWTKQPGLNPSPLYLSKYLIWAIVVGGILAQSYYGDVSNSTTIAQIKYLLK